MSPSLLTPPFDDEARRVISDAIRDGKLMAYPTETTYALGGNGLDSAAAGRVASLKRRPEGKPLPLLIDGEAMLGRVAGHLAPGVDRLMARCWPGPLTMVMPAAEGLPGAVMDASGTVAVRWSSHPVLTELLALGGVPLLGTSANRSGEPPLDSAEAVARTFGGEIDLIIGEGAAPPEPEWGPAAVSTLLDTTTMPFRILREGAVPAAIIRAVLVEANISAVPE